MRIDIKAVNKTPVGIIDSSNKTDTYIKKLVVCVNNSLYEVGYLPANGINGKLRRIMTGLLLEKTLSKGIKLTPVDFSLMNNGGGVNQKKKDKNNDDKGKKENKNNGDNKEKKKDKTTKKILADLKTLRKLNPVISIFGAGLTVAGKIAINNFVPFRNIIENFVDRRTINFDIKKPSYIQRMEIVRMDDIMNMSVAATKVFTLEELQTYQERLEKNKAEDTTSTQMLISKEYIVPGIIFYSSIMQLPDRYQLEEYEYGLILKTLEIFATSRIGSTQKSWGVMNYDMYEDEKYDSPFLQSQSDDEYVFNVKLTKQYSDEHQKAINEADKWLDSISAENVNLEKYFKTSVDEEEEESEG